MKTGILSRFFKKPHTYIHYNYPYIETVMNEPFGIAPGFGLLWKVRTKVAFFFPPSNIATLISPYAASYYPCYPNIHTYILNHTNIASN